MKRILIIILLFSAYWTVSAQGLLAYIIEEAIKDQVKSTIWGAIVDAGAESEVAERAHKIAQFPIDSSIIKNIQTESGINVSTIDYTTLYSNAQRKITKYLDVDASTKIKYLGNGAIVRKMDSIILDRESQIASRKLSEFLPPYIMDSLEKYNLYQKCAENFPQNKRVLYSFISNPESINLYSKIHQTAVSNDPKQLSYWTSSISWLHDSLPIEFKDSIITVSTLKFNPLCEYCEIACNDKVIGKMNTHQIYCETPDLMNFILMPDMRYYWKTCNIVTDCLGRIESTELVYNPNNYNKKNRSITKLEKQFNRIKSRNISGIIVNPMPLALGGPHTYCNEVSFAKYKINKQANRLLKKTVKKTISGKTAVKISAIFSYQGSSNEVSILTIHFPDQIICFYLEDQDKKL